MNVLTIEQINALLATFVEIKLKNDEDFLKVKETLTRIGVGSDKTKILYQSCHIFHKQGKYYITHFKEMIALDGKETNYSTDDIARRNTIANLLAEWGLVQISDPAKIADPRAPMTAIKVLPYKDKAEWTLVAKYTVGKKKE